MLIPDFFQEESGGNSVPLRSEGLEEKTTRSSKPHYDPVSSQIQSMCNQSCTRAEGKRRSFMHVQNSIYLEVKHPKTIRLNYFFSFLTALWAVSLQTGHQGPDEATAMCDLSGVTTVPNRAAAHARSLGEGAGRKATLLKSTEGTSFR